jgi:hypothetical protein
MCSQGSEFHRQGAPLLVKACMQTREMPLHPATQRNFEKESNWRRICFKPCWRGQYGFQGFMGETGDLSDVGASATAGTSLRFNSSNWLARSAG